MNLIVIIGFQRSGTTFLRNLLNNHPNILFAEPVRPEPKYFLKNNKELLDIKVYKKNYFYNLDKKIKFLGEKSTSYIENIESIKKIGILFPNAKFILLARDPVNRAISNYKFSYKNKIEKFSFEEAISIEMKGIVRSFKNISVNPYNYLSRGIYFKYYIELIKVIDKKNLSFLLFEELISNNNYLDNFYKSLDLTPQLIDIKNSPPLNKSFKKLSISEDFLKSLGEYYLPSITKLQNLLGIELKCWLRNSWYK